MTLTTAQRQFAVQHDAEPGSTDRSGLAVFFYAEHGNHAQRWLVDEEGQVLDEEQFD